MGVRVQRVNVAHRALRVGDVLLTDEHERAFRHPPLGDGALGRRDLARRARQMHGAGTTGLFRAPRHAAGDRELHLEGGGAGTEAAERLGGATGQAPPEDLGHGMRVHIEHDDVVRGQIAPGTNAAAGLERHATLTEPGDDGCGERSRSAGDDGPPHGVSGGDDARADPADERLVEALERVGRDAQEQSTGSLLGEGTRGPHRGQRGSGAEPREKQGVTRDADEGAEDVFRQRRERARRGAEQGLPPPSVGAEAGRGLDDRATEQHHVAVVERVGAVDLGEDPGRFRQVEVGEVRRAGRHRVDRGAVVLDEPREEGLAVARPSPEFVRRLDDVYVQARGRQGRGSGQPVGTAADDHCARHFETRSPRLRETVRTLFVTSVVWPGRQPSRSARAGWGRPRATAGRPRHPRRAIFPAR